MRRTVLNLAITLAAIYLLVAAFVYVSSDRLIFLPPPAGYDADSPDLVWLTASDGQRLPAFHLNDPSSEYTVLYNHGNAEDIGHVRPALEMLHRLGFSVLAYDYRGYGLSDGRPTVEGAYRDIEAAYGYLVEQRGVAPERIIVHGFSVGSGPAIDLAARRPIAGLVLVAPFTTAFRVVTRVPLLPFDRFRNIEKIDDVDAPVLVVHGTDDGIVPFAHGRSVFEAANEPKRRLWVEGAGHNDVLRVAGPAYAEALAAFRDELVGADTGAEP
ncbi:MAG: alpha/beta hydrolase [Gemmatimonadota bacterium]